jgi:hypothetical protein
MGLRFRVVSKDSTASLRGFGSIIDISRTGVLFGPSRACPTGTAVQLSIDWPVLCDGAFPIKLAVSGFVVRRDERGIAIRIARYGFEPMWDSPPNPELAGAEPS